MATGKGILKVNRTNKGKIFVEIDRLNNRPPMPLSYVVLPDTTLNGKECEYEANEKGIFLSIKVEGKEVWSRAVAVAPSSPQALASDGSKYPDSFSLSHTCLPKDVRGLPMKDTDNFYLKLQRAARYEQWKDSYKFTFYKNDHRQREYFEIKANYGHLKNNFDALCQRQAQQAERLFPGNSRSILLQPQWRFVLGLGGESVYETNMTLHHLYGMPYLPASSIKGVLRSWIISQVFAQEDNVPDHEKEFPLVNAEYRAITGSKLFCTIFGCPEDGQKVIFRDARLRKEIKDGKEKYAYADKESSALGSAHQGIVTFFDGLPTVAPVIKTDVMNPHYKDWYKDIGYSAPTDTQRTNPIHFLTVNDENGLQFQTHIGVSEGNPKLKDISDDYGRFLPGSNLNGDHSLADLVKFWLEKALSEHGIGSKTAVGYGFMKADSST